MSNDTYMNAHIDNPMWTINSPAATSDLNVGLMIEYLKTLPTDIPVYCAQVENFANGDSAIDYFPSNLKDCFVVENGILYIGNVEL